MPNRAKRPFASFRGGLELRTRIEWIAVTTVLTVFTALLSLFGTQVGLQRLDFTLYDMSLAAAAQRPVSDDIVIIAIDDGSIATLGHWPWRRALHADLLDRLPETRAIGIDIIFTDPNAFHPEDDQRLARAIAARSNVVLPLALSQGITLRPLPVLEQAAAATGYINIWPDADGSIRSLRLSATDASGASHPHMIAAMLSVDRAREKADGPSSLMERPREEDSPLLIPYAGPPGHFRAVPYVDVLAGNVDPVLFKGKFVLIGSWGTGLGDTFPTPLSHNTIPMSGIEILANGLQSSLEDRWIRTPPAWLSAIFAAIPVLLICLVLRRRSPRQAFFSLLIAVSLMLVLNGLLLWLALVWIPIAASLVGIVLSYPVWSWRSQEVALKQISLELGKLQDEQSPFKENLLATAQEDGDSSLPARIQHLHGAIGQLRNLRQFFTDSLDATPDATLIFDTAGITRFASQKAKAYSQAIQATPPYNGATAQSVLRRIITDTALRQAVIQSLSDPTHRQPQNLAWPMWNDDGLELRDAAGNDMLLKCVPIRTASGTDAGSILTLIDISPLRQAQRKREESLRFISHDMRSPQNSILALAQLQKSPETALPQTTLLQRMQHYASKTLRLVDGFVHLARAESMAIRIRSLNLSDLLMNACDELWALAQQRQIRISLENLPDYAGVQGDETMLSRALGNLLDNAIKYSGDDTVITCRIRHLPDQACWELTIQDQGRGIAPDRLGGIFQPFTRVDETIQGNPAGTGLGLAFVQAVITRHNGSIRVDSTPGAGSTFTLALPIFDEPAGDADI